jgi:transposase-like protein
MPNPFPIELRERAVRAYESGEGSHTAVAERFSLNPWTLLRWILRHRQTGSVAPLAKSGGLRVPGELLDGPQGRPLHCQVRTERVPQDVHALLDACHALSAAAPVHS